MITCHSETLYQFITPSSATFNHGFVKNTPLTSLWLLGWVPCSGHLPIPAACSQVLDHLHVRHCSLPSLSWTCRNSALLRQPLSHPHQRGPCCTSFAFSDMWGQGRRTWHLELNWRHVHSPLCEKWFYVAWYSLSILSKPRPFRNDQG